MITILSGTNRPGSYTRKVAEVYAERLKLAGISFAFFSLEDMPQDLLTNEMYGSSKNAYMSEIEQNIFIPGSKFVIIAPEYNGSFPGVLKAFIDASDIRKCWHNKKAALVGVADGRAGNLRGMEHLTNILNHMKINVLHLKIPVSSVSAQFDNSGSFVNQETLKLMDAQIQLFKEF